MSGGKHENKVEELWIHGARASSLYVTRNGTKNTEYWPEERENRNVNSSGLDGPGGEAKAT